MLSRLENLEIWTSKQTFSHISILKQKQLRFVMERTFFANMIFQISNLWKRLFSKNRPNFCLLSIIPRKNISKFPLNMFTFKHKSI